MEPLNVSIFALSLVLTSSEFVFAALAQEQEGAPNPQKREKCEQLARERDFLGDGRTKGAIKPWHLIQACMQGKVPGAYGRPLTLDFAIRSGLT